MSQYIWTYDASTVKSEFPIQMETLLGSILSTPLIESTCSLILATSEGKVQDVEELVNLNWRWESTRNNKSLTIHVTIEAIKSIPNVGPVS